MQYYLVQVWLPRNKASTPTNSSRVSPSRKCSTTSSTNTNRSDARGSPSFRSASLRANNNIDILSPWRSFESCYGEDESNKGTEGDGIPGAEEETLLCLMPTGIVFEVKVHPDNVISNIKQLAINTVMNNGRYKNHNLGKF